MPEVNGAIWFMFTLVVAGSIVSIAVNVSAMRTEQKKQHRELIEFLNDAMTFLGEALIDRDG